MKRACINHFLRERFPSKTWTSIAVLYNPSMPLHRDILNMIGHANHAVALGNFLEGRVWIEDENGQATTVLETKNGQKLLHGTWIDMHDYVQCSEISYAGKASRKHVGSCSIYASSVQACCCFASTSLLNLAFQFLSYGKHSNCVNPIRASIRLTLMKPNLERNHVACATKMFQARLET